MKYHIPTEHSNPGIAILLKACKRVDDRRRAMPHRVMFKTKRARKWKLDSEHSSRDPASERVEELIKQGFDAKEELIEEPKEEG